MSQPQQLLPASLPSECFILAPHLPVEHSLGKVRLGQSGFELVPLPEPCTTHDEVYRLVNRLNQEMGVSGLQCHCMRTGALWGWERPDSDPLTYQRAATASLLSSTAS